MRCPKCKVKTSDFRQHMFDKHPDCLSSTDEEDDNKKDKDDEDDNKEDKDKLSSEMSEDLSSDDDTDPTYKPAMPKGMRFKPLKATTTCRKSKRIASKPNSQGNKRKPKVKIPRMSNIKMPQASSSSQKDASKGSTTSKKDTCQASTTSKKDACQASKTSKKDASTASTTSKKDACKASTTSKDASTNTKPTQERIQMPTPVCQSIRQRRGGKRRRVHCPICQSYIVHLPRHLRQKHSMSQSDATKYIRTHRPEIKTPKPLKTRVYRICPIKSCESRVLYIPQHMRFVHGQSKAQARRSSRKARRIDESDTSSEDDDEEEEEEVEQPQEEELGDVREEQPQEAELGDVRKDQQEQDLGDQEQEENSTQETGQEEIEVGAATRRPHVESIHTRNRGNATSAMSDYGSDVVPPSTSQGQNLRQGLIQRRYELLMSRAMIKTIPKTSNGASTAVDQQEKGHLKYFGLLIEASEIEQIDTSTIPNTASTMPVDLTQEPRDEAAPSPRQYFDEIHTSDTAHVDMTASPEPLDLTQEPKDEAAPSPHRHVDEIQASDIQDIAQVDMTSAEPLNLTQKPKDEVAPSPHQHVDEIQASDTKDIAQVDMTSAEPLNLTQEPEDEVAPSPHQYVDEIQASDTQDIAQVDMTSAEPLNLTQEPKDEAASSPRQTSDNEIQTDTHEMDAAASPNSKWNMAPLDLSQEQEENEECSPCQLFESTETQHQVDLKNSSSPTLCLGAEVSSSPRTTPKKGTPKKRKTVPWWRRGETPVKSWKQVQYLQDFYKFLCSQERNMTEKEASQHCFQVYQIWVSVDKNLSKKALLDPERIKTQWFLHFASLRAPGTCKSYLASLKDFWNWLFVTQRTLKVKDTTYLMACRAMWLKSLRKKSQIRKFEVMTKDTESRLTPDDFERFRKSIIAEKVKQIFELVDKGEIITKNQWNLMVGFIVLNIAIDNAQRCGAILGLSMDSFANRKETDDGDNFVVLVSKHKTAAQGPVNLILIKEVCDWIILYMKARRNLPEHTTPLLMPNCMLFLKWPGAVMNHTDVDRLIKFAWRESGGKGDISFTKIRKSIVTAMRERNPECRDDLAAHMSHSVTTADSFYHLYERQKMSSKITKQIRQITQKGEQKSTPSTSTQSEVCDKSVLDLSMKAPIEDISLPNISPEEVSSTAHTPRKHPPKFDTSKLKSCSYEMIRAIGHARRSFDERDAYVIERACKHIIESDVPIRTAQIRWCLVNDVEGDELIPRLTRLHGQDMWKKVYDRVRTFRKQYQKKKDK